jgi:hypothetical protein
VQLRPYDVPVNCVAPSTVPNRFLVIQEIGQAKVVEEGTLLRFGGPRRLRPSLRSWPLRTAASASARCCAWTAALGAVRRGFGKQTDVSETEIEQLGAEIEKLQETEHHQKVVLEGSCAKSNLEPMVIGQVQRAGFLGWR